MLLFAMTASLLLSQAASAPDLTWIAGDWIACSNSRTVEERWIGSPSGTFVGANLTTSAEGSSFEFFRIAPNAGGTLTYFAQPFGRPAVEFKLVEASNQRAVFENPNHDFPQRVIYWRDGSRLAARIEGQIDGRTEGEEWRLNRNANAGGCGTAPAAR